MNKFSNFLQKLNFGLFLLLLVVIPLLPKIPLIPVKGSFVAIRIEDLLIALTLGLWFLSLLITRNFKSVFKERINQLVLIFFFIGALSTFTAVFLTHSVISNISILHYLRRIEVMLLLPLALNVVKTKKQLISVFVTFTVVTLLICLYGLGQQYLHFPLITTINQELAKGQIIYADQWVRINSTFAGHYDLAVYLTMFLSISVALVFYLKNYIYKSGFILLSLLASFILVLTAARLSFVATFLSVISVLVLTGKKLVIFAIVLLTIGLLIYPSQLKDRLLSTLSVFNPTGTARYTNANEQDLKKQRLNIFNLPHPSSTPTKNDAKISSEAANLLVGNVPPDIAPGEPIDSTQRGIERSFDIRIKVEWPRAVRAFYKNPFLGTGYSSIELATDNDYLRSIGEVGLLGTLSFALIIIEVLKRFFDYYKSSNKLLKYFSAGLLSMVFAVLVNAVFIDVFEASKVASMFWIIIGVGLVAGRILAGKKAQE